MTPEVLPRPFVKWTAAAFGFWIVVVILNPFFSDYLLQANALLAGEAVFALVFWAVAFLRARRIDESTSPDSRLSLRESTSSATFAERKATAAAAFSPRLVLSLALLFLAALFLHRYHWFHPRFIDDDLINLRIAQSWDSTREHLFKPFNEHLLVPTRLWAFAAVQTTTQESLPHALLVQIWILYGVALVQLFFLARREFGSDATGLWAVAGFCLTFIHHECLWWFMAAQWLWTLNLLLAVWLILDPAKPSAARANLATMLAFLGLFTFSIGLVIGPCAAMWIACRWRERRNLWWRPLVGTLLGLLATAPLVAAGLRQQDPGKANVKLKWFELDLWHGMGTTTRLVVDYLVFKLVCLPPFFVPPGLAEAFKPLGVPTGIWPPLLSAMVFPFVAAIPVLVLKKKPACWRLAPFLVLAILNFGIVIPFRSWMDYPQMAHWTARYQLLPHLGVTLFLVGAWFEGRSGRQSLAWPMLAAAAWFVFQETMHGGWTQP
jgi:hypothetical protein